MTPEPDRAMSRITTLDALRGIAAFVVVIHHILLASSQFNAVYNGGKVAGVAKIMGFTPLHVLWAGQEAVIIFFILSGFVLSLPFWRGKDITFTGFAIKRIVRLYPPYIVAVFIAALLMTLIVRRPPDPWMGGYWPGILTWRVVLEHVAMIGSPTRNYIDAPVWSLWVEMQISIIFPLMIMAMRRLGRWSVPVAILLSLSQKIAPLPVTVYYLWLFVLGAEIARHRPALEGFLRGLSSWGQVGLLVCSLLALIVRWIVPHVNIVAPLIVGAGAAGIVVACDGMSILRSALQSRLTIWLGQISYSLYLTHYIVLSAILCLFDGRMPLPFLLVAVLPLALVTGSLFHAAFEVPSIQLSRLASRRLESQ